MSEASGATRAEIDVEVRYAETDAQGVVHHANYLVWFELARTRLCALSGLHYRDIEEMGYQLVVTAADLRYRGAARYGDTVRASCWIERLGSRGIRFAYEIGRDGELLVTGHTDHVWIDIGSRRPVQTPQPLRAPFRELAGG